MTPSGDIWKWVAGMLASAMISGGVTFWAARTDAYTKAEVDHKLAPLAEVRDDLRDLIARLEERRVIERRGRRGG